MPGAVDPWKWEPVGGGSINETYSVASGTQRLFVKYSQTVGLPGLLAAEKRGLEYLSLHGTIRTPVVFGDGEFKGWQWLVTEWIGSSATTAAFWEQFGRQLASLHRVTAPAFGFDADNYMGALAQQNSWCDSWPDFFFRHRLEPQAQLAAAKKLLSATDLEALDVLRKRLPDVFAPDPPSLLHGDLWSGNFICDAAQQPVLIDPAVYYGHRYMDVAMTSLFGGFDQRFYDAYDEEFPFTGDVKEQCDICNLYPLLIHLNLFGAAYYGKIHRALRRFHK
jgi:fructosamine-3-kinase